MELFQGGYISVGDRNPHVVEITGDYGFDYAEVVAKLEFHEAVLPPRVGGGGASTDQRMEQFFVQKELS